MELLEINIGNPNYLWSKGDYVEVCTYYDDIVVAIEGAIAKWDSIAYGYIGDNGSTNCPLCILFMEGRGNCSRIDYEQQVAFRCPVYSVTGTDGCSNSPWVSYNRMARPELFDTVLTIPDIIRNGFLPCDIVEHEIDFLISLLPDGHPIKLEVASYE